MHLPKTIFRTPFLLATLATTSFLVMTPTVGLSQVRTKKPDRGVYQSPRLPGTIKTRDDQESDFAALVRSRDPLAKTRSSAGRSSAPAHAESALPTKNKRELIDVDLTNARGETESHQSQPSQRVDATATLKRVRHEDVILVSPDDDLPPPSAKSVAPNTIDQDRADLGIQAPIVDHETWHDDAHRSVEHQSDQLGFLHDNTCDGCPDCSPMGCDSLGCDSMGQCSSPWYRRWGNASICCAPNNWFGSAELMLMFRKGNRFPSLVTTGSDADPDTAGELGQPGTRVLVGGDTVLNDMTAGGRFMVGTWLDNRQCQSLVLRGWFAGEEKYGFSTNQNQHPVIARPFLNVSDNQPAAQDAFLVAFPNRANGSLSLRASSDVYGGDVQIRQFWYGKYGGSVDFLYGYQYMRLDEDLSISSTSTSLDNDFAPVGSIISVTDSFDTENEFHGGQVGVSSRYREGCWSFNSLLKFGFGSLSRRANLNGSTFTSIDGANAIDPNGLLVRNTNAGTINNHTFGWVPELDLSLGWQYFPRFDVTFGYHIVAMTDALQVSRVIDPNLAVNLSVPPTGQQRPALVTSYDTYYVQGIHFGLQYVY